MSKYIIELSAKVVDTRCREMRVHANSREEAIQKAISSFQSAYPNCIECKTRLIDEITNPARKPYTRKEPSIL